MIYRWNHRRKSGKFASATTGRSRGRTGVAAVEMALVSLVLGSLVVGLFEVSRGIAVLQNLTDAARKGCRTGILHQYGNSDVISDATGVLRNVGFDSSKFNPPSVGFVTITVTDPDGNTLTET